MSREIAIAAYRQSAYQKIEYDIETSLGKANFPIIGGIRGEVKMVFNRLLLPFKMLSGYLLGGEYKIDKIEPVAITPELADTQYGQALGKLRQNAREVADMRAQSWNHFLDGEWTHGFRMRRAAKYAENQNRMVVLPDEGSGIIDVAAAGAIAYGSAKLTRDAMVDRLNATGKDNSNSSLGTLSTPMASLMEPPMSAKILDYAGKLFTK